MYTFVIMGRKGFIRSGASDNPKKTFAVEFILSVGLVFIITFITNETFKIRYCMAPK